MSEYLRLKSEVFPDQYFTGPKGGCIFCKHCTDFFWDFTNGPYMFLCSLDQDTEKAHKDLANGNICAHYEQDDECEEIGGTTK